MNARAASAPSRLAAILVLVASPCVAGTLGCQAVDEGAVALGVVEGIVIDPLHERPAAGVSVRAHDMGEAVSDAEGRFVLALPAGTHTLYLAGPGYLAGQREGVRVQAGKTVAVEAEVFPSAPSDAAIDAYFARRGPRGRQHPAFRDPDEAPPVGQPLDGEAEGEEQPDESVGGAVQALVELPSEIRVWRSSLAGALAPTAGNGWADNSCHPSVQVEVLPLEEYVRGVVPHEWISSWHAESLRAGAIAARTFAVRWALRGGRWDCADVDDGTVTQVYRSTRTESGNAAVAATEGQVVTRDGAIISTEYSAENSDPTEFGVAEPTCTGTTRFGHGRGMCQWGTQRWANGICANPPCSFGALGAEPKDHVWMVEHYYPGAIVEAAYVEPTTPCAIIPAAGGLVDEEGPCFRAFGNPTYWREETAGHNGHLFWTNAFVSDAPANWARWRLHFEAAGSYAIAVYVDPAFGVYDQTRYVIADADGETEVIIDQGSADGFTSLGVFRFEDEGELRLFDNVSGSVPANQHIVADAISLTRVVVPPVDAGMMTGDLGPDSDGGSGGDAGPGRRPSSGCGCRVGSSETAAPSPGLALALLTLGLARARRRRQRL